MSEATSIEKRLGSPLLCFQAKLEDQLARTSAKGNWRIFESDRDESGTV